MVAWKIFHLSLSKRAKPCVSITEFQNFNSLFVFRQERSQHYSVKFVLEHSENEEEKSRKLSRNYFDWLSKEKIKEWEVVSSITNGHTSFCTLANFSNVSQCGAWFAVWRNFFTLKLMKAFFFNLLKLLQMISKQNKFYCT